MLHTQQCSQGTGKLPMTSPHRWFPVVSAQVVRNQRVLTRQRRVESPDEIFVDLEEVVALQYWEMMN